MKTSTPQIDSARKMLMQLLLARCPDAQPLWDLAKRLGVEGTPFPKEDPKTHHRCILCALCTRACAEVVQAHAISFVNRGSDRQMAIPFYDNTEACIACGSCAYICPTNAIIMEDRGAVRRFEMPHNVMEFERARCAKCGQYWAPRKQIYAMAKRSGQPLSFFDVCTDCRS